MKPWFLTVLITSTAFADAVTDWNIIMRDTVSSQPPLYQARFAAITHLAVFEAVNAIAKDYKPYLGGINPVSGASIDAAAVAAAHRVLRYYFPDRAERLDSERDRSLANIPDSSSKNAGAVVGETAASAMIARRSNDGSGTVMAYTPLNGVGFWQPTPPNFLRERFFTGPK